ncbi:MAG: alkaline phosphatase family protein [Polyangiaceae bacterium]|nr:alkaline phosphatase family protein [Polyangiaceae bacterium]
MPAKHLVLGLDGADLDLVRALGPERLPCLHAIMRRGAYAHLESVEPPATLPNWTTFLTGLDPGRHGVFDFTTRRGYGVRFTAGTVREAPTVFARLDRLDLRCACLFFPATWPPERLGNGIFASGWDAPVAFEADRSFVWPPALHDRLVREFGPLRFDDVDEFDADRPGWHERLPDALVARIEQKTALARHLLEGEHWDAFAFYFGESDTAAHHLFGLHDADSPRHPRDARSVDGLARVYEALDRAVGELVDVAGGVGVEVTILSDHGSGGSSDKVLYLNRALERAGLLSFRSSAVESAIVGAAKDVALTLLPPSLRERLFSLGGAVLPSLLESRARYGAIDFDKTEAFNDELNYFPGIHLNVRGREPRGTVSPADVEAVTRRVEEALFALRDPWSNTRVVRAVHRRRDLFEGPYVSRAPDLLVTLELDGGYSYNLMPSSTGPVDGSLFRKLTEAEYLGRKGRSLPGSHRPRGFFAAAGPRIAAAGEIDARIADVTATLLARMDVAVPSELAGRVLYEALDACAPSATTPLPNAARHRTDERADERRVEARLRALGYID